MWESLLDDLTRVRQGWSGTRTLARAHITQAAPPSPSI